MKLGAVVTALLAATTLAALGQTPQQAGQASSTARANRSANRSGGASWSISGVVVSAATGAQLDRAEVTLSTPGQQGTRLTQTVTGENGMFRFDALEAGKYVLEASRRGYIASAYDEHEGGYSTAIVTGPGLESQNLRFALEPAGIISGVVMDDTGEPLRSGQVALYRSMQTTGVDKVLMAGSDQTDDDGYYEFTRLQPGVYYVSVTATPWYAFHPAPRNSGDGAAAADDELSRSPLDVAYPLTFYPNATDSGSATAIPLRAGDHLEANVSLHAVPAIHLRISVPMPSAPGRGIGMPQLAEDVFGNEQFVGFSRGMRNDGHSLMADLSGIAPGQYTLRQFGPQGEETRDATIDATGNQTIDLAGTAPGIDVAGRLVMHSGQKLPANTTISLRQPGSDRWANPAKVAEDGSFDLQGVGTGVRQIEVNAPGKALRVFQAAASGAELHGDQITIGSQPVLLAATLVSGSAMVTGYVKQDGRGVGGAMVLLVPNDLLASREIYRRDQSDSDGSFSLGDVIPGTYTLVAIENGWGLEWGRPEVIGPYLARGVRVEVSEGKKELELPEAIALQSR